jgi:hypothetical protein
MKEKPYKTNKSSLDKFLEKREVPVCKDLIGKPVVGTYTYYCAKVYRLLKHDESEETKARLEAAGFTLNKESIVGIKGNPIEAWKSYERLVDLDKVKNDPSVWYFSFSSSSMRGYFVAGVRYKDKTEFMLSRTELGKALL